MGATSGESIPDVSVVVPVLNEADTIGPLFDAVRSALERDGNHTGEYDPGGLRRLPEHGGELRVPLGVLLSVADAIRAVLST